tara:strand:- start:105 stop:605 length:501 start_codon:yes stop_codon:yes gene_type:complete
MTPEEIAAKGQTDKGKRQVGLENVVRLWPTPTATVWGGTAEAHLARKEKHKCGQVVSELGVFATHVFRLDREIDRPGPQSSQSAQSSLPQWATPTVSESATTEAKWARDNAAMKAKNPNLGAKEKKLSTQAIGNNASMRLNPLFVEWLMGWPEEWSNVPSNTARND